MKSPKVTSVTVTNVMLRASAEPLVKLLDGMSYLDLNVCVCPVSGSFDVVVSTTKAKTQKELEGMVMMLLAGAVISDKARQPPQTPVEPVNEWMMHSTPGGWKGAGR